MVSNAHVPLTNSYNNSVFLDPITEKKVEVEISQLNENKATGYDDLAPKLIVKKISKYTVPPLTYIFNQTFLTGVLPKELKIALVTPVFKANERDQFKNYRPISILPCFSKILEKLMYKRLLKYLERHNILSDNQYKFRKKRSLNLATTQLLTRILRSIDNKEYTIGVFLDFAKALNIMESGE